MSDYEEEIEYLDEDADIVQQCVQNTSYETPKPTLKDAGKQKTSIAKRRSTRYTKRKYEEDDSDFDPADCSEPPVTRSSKNKKAVVHNTVVAVPKTLIKSSKPDSNTSIKQEVKTPLKQPRSAPRMINKSPFDDIAKLDIRIPDYEDPMCLPVKHYMLHNFKSSKNSHNSTLTLWNQLCLEHLSTASVALKTEEGNTVKSTRSLTFKKEISKTGEMEMCVSSETAVTNESGDTNSEMYTAPLPRFKEQRQLDFNFRDDSLVYMPVVPKKFTIQLTKEVKDNKESLLMYKLEEGTIAVYDTVENESDNEESLNRDPNDTSRRYLQERFRCSQCVDCYQHSYRQHHTKERESLNLKCPICRRGAVSVYNLLKHVRTHSPRSVRAHAHNIAHIISKILDYHYRCKLCSTKFLSIKKMRAHLDTHKCKQSFNCDFCNKTIVGSN